MEPLTDAGARAAGVLCGSAGTADVIDASVVLSARRWDATVVTADRSDVQVLDPAARIVEW